MRPLGYHVSMNLYPYQQEIVKEVLKNFETKNRQMAVVPTGGGKTVIFCYIASFLNVKTLVVGHTKELISQCEKTLQKMGIKNVTAMTIQRVGVLLKKRTLGDYGFLVVDECHRGGAKTYQNLINTFSNGKVLGVTATPFRHDGQKLKEIFGEKVSPLSLIDMIENKLLCDFEGYKVLTKCSLKDVKTKNGDFLPGGLESVINVSNRNQLIVDEYLKISPNEKALCFAANIKHCDELSREFRSKGISCLSVHGELSRNERVRAINEFKTGNVRVLTSCQILTEGFDEPSVTCILLARPTCSKVLYTQMIGRGSRLFPGKSVCKVIEFTDNDYDVTSLEELISPEAKRFNIKNGEKLSEFFTRIKKPLTNYGIETVANRIDIIPRSIYEKPASEWQISYLMKLGIKFTPPLTDFVANQLILQATNG